MMELILIFYIMLKGSKLDLFYNNLTYSDAQYALQIWYIYIYWAIICISPLTFHYD
jgi:hypothetical protein